MVDDSPFTLKQDPDEDPEWRRPPNFSTLATEHHVAPTGDTRCGIGQYKPRCLQPCANVKLYTFFLAAIIFVINTMWVYRMGVLSTLEKRFRMSSSESSFTVSAFEIGHLSTVLFISYIGGKMNKPRVVAFGGILCALSGLLFPLPHVLYGSGRETLPLASGVVGNDTAHWLAKAPLCTEARLSGSGNESSCDENVEMDAEHANNGAYVILILSSVILGVSLVPMNTLGVTYIYDNVEKEKAPMYFGVTVCMAQAGMIAGFSLAGIFTNIDIDLTERDDIRPSDPRWLGAWWLGMLILAAATLPLVVGMWLFPSHLPNAPKMAGLAKQASDANKVSLKDMLLSLKMLFVNASLVALILGFCCDAYLYAGYVTFMSKYLEIQFNLSAYAANIFSAIVSGVTACVGSILGGLIASRLSTARRMCVFLVIASAAGSAAVAILAVLGCDDQRLAGTYPDNGPFTLESSCNSHCVAGCTTAEMFPICGVDGSTYFSPCYAGCADVTLTGPVINFTDCACVPKGGWAGQGTCDYSCDMLPIYSAVLVLAMLLSTVTPPAIMALVLRVVDGDVKDLALGIVNISLSVLTYIPAPIVFGAAIDSVCDVWQEVCGGRRGACWSYNITHYRIIIHGLTAIFKAMAIPCFAILFCLQKGRRDEGQEAEVSEENRGRIEMTKSGVTTGDALL